LQSTGPIRVGSIGLGAGVLTAYSRPGDAYTIYEINPLVRDIAQSQFSFYPHSQAAKRILLGDARLTLERQEPQQFDLLSVDAFTGDAIPVHLLTLEAMTLYFKHLQPHGILAVHISNQYVDLAPVCARNAEALGKRAVVVEDNGGDASYLSASTWVLLTGDPAWFDAPSFAGATLSSAGAPQGFRTWTDDYSNMLQIMRFR
jgi:spermidine synthase